MKRRSGREGVEEKERERERERKKKRERERERGALTSMLLPKYALIIHTQEPVSHVELSSEPDQSRPLSSSPCPCSINDTTAAEIKIRGGAEEGGEETVCQTYDSGQITPNRSKYVLGEAQRA